MNDQVQRKIVRLVNKKDIIGLQSKSLIPTVSPLKVFTVSSESVCAEINCRIMNNSTADIEVKVWVSKSNMLDEIDLIEPGVILKSKAVYNTGSLVLSTGESVYVQSDVTGAIIRIDGVQNGSL